MTDKKLTKTQETKLAAVSSFEQDGGLGQENMSKDDYVIPRLKILQALSEQINSIDGAKAGMIIDSVEENLIAGDVGLAVLPIAYAKIHLEWQPRKAGGGLAGVHKADYDLTNCTRNDRGEYVTPEGNTIMPTAEYYVYVIKEDGTYSPYALSMHGSQIKKSRKWNTMINQLRLPKSNGEGTFNPAMFYRSYKLESVPESNDQGNWFGWKITGDKNVTEIDDGAQMYQDAKAFRDQIVSGEVKTAKHDGDAKASEDDADAPF
tara:strand:- start:1001 stop:1786 length:786 start_codon:yes stop_codon:yes gene_type:complete